MNLSFAACFGRGLTLGYYRGLDSLFEIPWTIVTEGIRDQNIVSYLRFFISLRLGVRPSGLGILSLAFLA